MRRQIRVVAPGLLVFLGAALSCASGTASVVRGSLPDTVDSRVDSKSGLAFVHIPGGAFHFGCEPQDSACDDDEKPGREVAVGSFWLGKTDVTVAAYQQCIAAGACEDIPTDDAQHRCNLKNGRLDHPINCIDWKQAQSFCGWIGGRLPTEEEWEFAAKGGSSRVYPWGDSPLDATRANVCDRQCRLADPTFTWADSTLDDGFGATSPVGSFSAGASRWGLLDMTGNVWQWTASAYGETASKVQRGGAWSDLPRHARASDRYRNDPALRIPSIGVRCGM